MTRSRLAARWQPWALLALALAVRLLTAWLLDQPGYTDAYYYAVGARQLHAGQGFDEPFIWNWLDPPQSLPHPGYQYWMPLTAILGWLGLAALGDSFRAIQAPFVLISALLPLVAYLVAWDLTGQRKHALLAGLLAVFPGFYAPVLVVSDNFAPFALAGSLCLWAAGRGLRDRRPLWFALAGLAAGFAHLSRADGLLLAGVALLTAVALPLALQAKSNRHPTPSSHHPTSSNRHLTSSSHHLTPSNHHLTSSNHHLTPSNHHLTSSSHHLTPSSHHLTSSNHHLTSSSHHLTSSNRWRAALVGLALVVIGYLLVMGPWFLRNWQTFGAIIPGAGARTLFLTTYDDMFAYGRPLTLQNYLDWGWAAILGSKWEALLLNAQRLWVENLLIFLLPFTALGLWRFRRKRLLWPFFLYLPLLFLAMTVAFTFSGMRGGLFHSGGALLPFLFAPVGPGLEVAVRWAARRLRGWHARRAWPVFGAGLVGLAILLTTFVLWRAGAFSGEWNRRGGSYTEIGRRLAEQGASAAAVVMVGDAPAFAWHTEQPAIAIPNEPPDTILAVADRYNARFLVLDDTRPRTTDDLYASQAAHPRLVLLYTVAPGAQVYEVVP